MLFKTQFLVTYHEIEINAPLIHPIKSINVNPSSPTSHSGHKKEFIFLGSLSSPLPFLNNNLTGPFQYKNSYKTSEVATIQAIVTIISKITLIYSKNKYIKTSIKLVPNTK
jgi:hypothetical protein